MENLEQNANLSDYNTNDEYCTRLISPLEQKILYLTKEERDQLFFDALGQLNEAEKIIHAINKVNDEYGQQLEIEY